MDSDTPTLFIVGEHAQNCPITELENMRERMRAQNSLVVVSGANDNLNVNFKTKKERCVTQSMVDRILLVSGRLFAEELDLPYVVVRATGLHYYCKYSFITHALSKRYNSKYLWKYWFHYFSTSINTCTESIITVRSKHVCCIWPIMLMPC